MYLSYNKNFHIIKLKTSYGKHIPRKSRSAKSYLYNVNYT